MKVLPFEEIPHFVQIETTYSCNARCKFCYNPRRDIPFNRLQFQKIVKAIAKARIPHVQFTGGEVSLLPGDVINWAINYLAPSSAVSIQTNGIIYLKGLNKNLAAIYISLHGTKEYHEALNQTPGSWEKTVASIQKYIQDGFEVNCDFTLTSFNYSNFEKIALLANKWGVHQYSVNKFERAGLGMASFAQLSPSVEQFRRLVTQMIRVQKKTKMLVGFCTAIPFCLDLRLPEYGLTSSCGAGVSFLSISPEGEVRICNQSDRSYGNVLKDDLIKIWRSKKIDEFRDLSWVNKPCRGCFLFDLCLGGCKVDNALPQKYCVDYAIRGLKKCPVTPKEWEKRIEKYQQKLKKRSTKIQISQHDIFYPDKFTKLNLAYNTNLLVTRYQTVKLDTEGMFLLKELIKGEISTEKLLSRGKMLGCQAEEIYNFLLSLLRIGAVHKKETK